MPTLLYNRTCYTLLESTVRVEQLVSFAKKHDYRSIAICDHNVMHGYMLFRKLCESNGIHPVFGLEVDVVDNDHVYSFLVFAKNDSGYNTLVKMSSSVNIHGPIAYSDFVKLCKDVIVIVPSENGILESYISSEQMDDVRLVLERCREDFDSFYVGYANPNSAYWKVKNEVVRDICNRLSIPMVALSLALYATDDDYEAYQSLVAIKHGRLLSDTSLPYKKHYRLYNPFELKDYPIDVLENTDKIALECNVLFKQEKTTIPEFVCPQNVTSNVYLQLLCEKGLQKRLNNKVTKVYSDRLKYELKMISKMGFSDYFLIVWDFILFSRKQGIYVGPGRGSAAGSLVAYCLGITHIDPIEHNLLFERFLNPERVSMPDIDIDFPDNRRDEVIQYVKEKYGNQHIAHIVTFGTMAAKQALRDVGRVLDIPTSKIDMITKTVPNTLKITLREAYETSPRFKQFIHSEVQFERLYRLACQLEGLPRHTSTHAAGIVMSNKPLTDIVPLIQIEQDVVSTQYSMEYLEDLGLLKMDFLGLRNLTIIDEIVQDINQTKPLDILKIPTNEKKTYELIQNVDTTGIFQLESDGMKALIRKLKPRNFEEIAVTIALFRPGPMENIPEYLKRREQPQLVTYPHKDVMPILQETYGIMVYQEQIMQVSQVMANFSLAKADILRKAMSKKKESELVNLKQDFISGCISKGYSKEIAVYTYDLILKFASYGFNKSHSVAYALLAYQLAYLKANYPLYFYRSLLNSVIGSEIKTFEYISECKQKNIQVLSPCINRSLKTFTIENNSIRFPLLSIKNVGTVACDAIITERNENGQFKDFYDFVVRISTRKVNRNTLERLIDAGALDCFNLTRKSMKLSLPAVLKYADLVKCDVQGQIVIDLDMVSKPVLVNQADYLLEKAELEKEALGFYLNQHPIEAIKQNLPYTFSNLKQAVKQKGNIQVFVQIRKVRQHRSKKGDLMCFVSALDETMEYDFVIMPGLYGSLMNDIVRGNYVYIEGVIDERDSCLVKKLVKYNMQS